MSTFNTGLYKYIFSEEKEVFKPKTEEQKIPKPNNQEQHSDCSRYKSKNPPIGISLGFSDEESAGLAPAAQTEIKNAAIQHINLMTAVASQSARFKEMVTASCWPVTVSNYSIFLTSHVQADAQSLLNDMYGANKIHIPLLRADALTLAMSNDNSNDVVLAVYANDQSLKQNDNLYGLTFYAAVVHEFIGHGYVYLSKQFDQGAASGQVSPVNSEEKIAFERSVAFLKETKTYLQTVPNTEALISPMDTIIAKEEAMKAGCDKAP